MNEKTFQALVRYGSILIAVCLILNVWVVMRHVEIYRDAAKVDLRLQQVMAQQQIVQTVLQEFAVRASSDSEIASIFKKAQAMSSATGTVSDARNQSLPPMATPGAGR
ncbi:MAG TPA: hypothetical protein VL171_13265 [Verrucomicrobiae bacterium]|nr:hypothetical protein [Verrucomicrobiae bacterium]